MESEGVLVQARERAGIEWREVAGDISIGRQGI